MSVQQITVGKMVFRPTDRRLEIYLNDVQLFDLPVTCLVERVGAHEPDLGVRF